MTTIAAPNLDEIKQRALTSLDAVADLAAAQEWERTYLGAKGELTGFLRSLGSLPVDERPAAGRARLIVGV